MTVSEFVAKWSQSQLSERSAAQQHFLDLCALAGHPTPAAADPAGETFTFERGAAKHGGGDGWADIWKRGFFGWEYKGKHKDLEKNIILHAMELGFTAPLPAVGPWQLFGIEISPYAHDLAQMSVWIGFLQWTRTNGFPVTQTPVLRTMNNFQCKDAILDLSDPDNPTEPDWPTVDFIVGNPPFLGDKIMRGELSDDYVEKLRELYFGRVPGGADLCCYWFERARTEIAAKKCHRTGLLATQGIRGGANRMVLKRIKETGDIFFAESDRPWVLNGASVHVSMIGFDGGEEKMRSLDGTTVSVIHSNLSSVADIASAAKLSSNKNLAFIGPTKGGAFDLDDSLGIKLLESGGNPHGRPSSDVIKPIQNGSDVLKRGPWARFLRDPDAAGIGTVRYPRLVARDSECAAKLAKRTLIFLAVIFDAAKGNGEEDGITSFLPAWQRTVVFGPAGPPWAGEEPPFVLQGKTVFASSIAEVREVGPKAPDVEIRNGVPRTLAGTGRPATVWVTLHSGEQLSVPSAEAGRLHAWFHRLGVRKEPFSSG